MILFSLSWIRSYLKQVSTSLCFGGWLQEDDQGDEVFSGSMSFANYSHFKAEKSDQFWSGSQPRIVSQPVFERPEVTVTWKIIFDQ